MKKFLISLSLVFVLSSSISVISFANTNKDIHSWKVLNANVDSGKILSHEFNNTKDNLTYTSDNCEIIIYNSTYSKECTICGAKESGSDKDIIHLNSNCHKYD
ncbi:hypothetical protein [Clostridium weizhouense]|uniref:Uncharacterized protein n=1 Tax=Clostridium weizhouense TaxID=2859781 RepID=A0ABS7AKY5_9CLOT|nr:hypothetical protein [Clostridium weizhouense]MBW6409329.1 hypothetical protein [Clostridium weizhouense]